MKKDLAREVSLLNKLSKQKATGSIDIVKAKANVQKMRKNLKLELKLLKKLTGIKLYHKKAAKKAAKKAKKAAKKAKKAAKKAKKAAKKAKKAAKKAKNKFLELRDCGVFVNRAKNVCLENCRNSTCMAGCKAKLTDLICTDKSYPASWKFSESC